MRQRKVKNEEAKLAALSEYMVTDGTEHKGSWRDVFAAGTSPEDDGASVGAGFGATATEQAEAERPLILEMGSGRGHFLAAYAEKNPQCLYLGAEGRSSIVLRALEVAKEMKLNNVLFIPEFIRNVEDYFGVRELSGLYLNFSDPWPKARHAKRRLTHRSFLEGYRRVLKPGSFIEIKTDNDALFDFTLEECAAVGMEILEMSRDLHRTELPARLITTQYEERFRLLNKSINYCRILV